MEEFIKQTKEIMKTELQDCIDNGFNPCCHVANWNHFKDRMIENLMNSSGLSEDEYSEQFHSAIDDMKPIVEQWLEYYKQHDEDGAYVAWLEVFWTDESPNENYKQKFYMERMYEKFVKAGMIEIYYYSFSSSEIRQAFLAKWHQRHSIPYTEDTGLDLYIGQKNKPGNFYGGYDEFYEPLEFPQKSDWWKLVNQILEAEKH